MANVPTKFVLDMRSSGMNDSEIIKRLREQGYTEKEINDAFNQAKVKEIIKESVSENKDLPPLPSPSADKNEYEQSSYELVPTPPNIDITDVNAPTPTQPPQPTQVSTPLSEDVRQSYEPVEEYGYGYEPDYTIETFEELAESIIEEKWREFIEKLGDIQTWKDSVNREITRLEKRVEKIEELISRIQAALFEKVGEYGKSLKELSTDVKAVEKVLSKVLSPLMKKVKEKVKEK